jgi:mannitol/fructose-specific phosphotransferase system IIA component (Ntr-type)
MSKILKMENIRLNEKFESKYDAIRMAAIGFRRLCG